MKPRGPQLKVTHYRGIRADWGSEPQNEPEPLTEVPLPRLRALRVHVNEPFEIITCTIGARALSFENINSNTDIIATMRGIGEGRGPQYPPHLLKKLSCRLRA